MNLLNTVDPPKKVPEFAERKGLVDPNHSGEEVKENERNFFDGRIELLVADGTSRGSSIRSGTGETQTHAGRNASQRRLIEGELRKDESCGCYCMAVQNGAAP